MRKALAVLFAKAKARGAAVTLLWDRVVGSSHPNTVSLTWLDPCHVMVTPPSLVDGIHFGGIIVSLGHVVLIPQGPPAVRVVGGLVGMAGCN